MMQIRYKLLMLTLTIGDVMKATNRQVSQNLQDLLIVGGLCATFAVLGNAFDIKIPDSPAVVVMPTAKAQAPAVR